MRIVYHHRTQMDDAQGIHISELVNAFRALGHEVELIGLVRKPRDGEHKEGGGFWAQIAGLMPPLAYELSELGYNFYAFWRLTFHGLRRRPRFIYERYSLFTFGGLFAARLLRVPFILEVNAPIAWEKSHYGTLVLAGLARSIERYVCSHADHTIVVSSVLAERLKHDGIPADRMILMPNGIDPTRFNPQIDGQSVRKRHAIPHLAPVAGVIGWFRPWHGLDALIRACADHHLFELRDLYLLLVGDGPAIPEARRLAQDLGCADRVIVTGPVSHQDIPSYGAAMDIAVQPRATDYACPMKIIEYLALGRKIVAPDQPNIRDILEDGKNALLFVPEDYSSLASAIEKIIANSDLGRRLAYAATATIAERDLTWSGNANRVIDLVVQPSH